MEKRGVSLITVWNCCYSNGIVQSFDWLWLPPFTFSDENLAHAHIQGIGVTDLCEDWAN